MEKRETKPVNWRIDKKRLKLLEQEAQQRGFRSPGALINHILADRYELGIPVYKN